MIVSHKHRFIFFAVPRTATHTLRRALAPHLGADDWEQENLFTAKRLPISTLAAKKNGHISAIEIRPHLSDDIWNSYFKFAFVRNPFDRFISACFFLNRNNPAFAPMAIPSMKQALQSSAFRQRLLVLPQHCLLEDEAGNPVMDFVGKYERLQRDYETVCERLGIEPGVLPAENRSSHGNYADYYDADLKESVSALYRTDLNLYDYEFAGEGADAGLN